MIASENEVLEEVAGLTTSQLDQMRHQAQNDLFFLSKGVLGRPHVNARTHGAFCRFIQREGEKRRKMGLMPRAHLKSTLGTVDDSTRLALKDPDNTRILIAGETATLSEGFLKQIKGHFESNKLLRGLFPELVPERFSGPGVQWSSDQASIVRSSNWSEPTWRATGVGGASVGFHFTRIKCDDLIGLEAYKSAAKMQFAKLWVDSIEPLLVDQNTDQIEFYGTRWSRNDLYQYVIGNYANEIAVFTRSAIENGEIIFPELHNWEEYRRIQKINPALWAAQYENNPLAVINGDLPVGSLRAYYFSLDGSQVLLDNGHRYDIESLDRVLTADPNSGSLVAPDTAAISVQGVTPLDEVIQLDSWSGRVTASEFVDQIYNRAKIWKVRVAGIEQAGQQNTAHYFKLKAERESFHISVEPLKPGTTVSKPDRIRAAIEPLIRSGLYFLNASQSVLRQQIGEFPDCIIWDELDAAAYGPRLFRRPLSREKQEERPNVIRKLMSLRNAVTGY